MAVHWIPTRNQPSAYYSHAMDENGLWLASTEEGHTDYEQTVQTDWSIDSMYRNLVRTLVSY